MLFVWRFSGKFDQRGTMFRKLVLQKKKKSRFVISSRAVKYNHFFRFYYWKLPQILVWSPPPMCVFFLVASPRLDKETHWMRRRSHGLALQQGKETSHQRNRRADAVFSYRKRTFPAVDVSCASTALTLPGDVGVSSSSFKLKCLQLEALRQLSYWHQWRHLNTGYWKWEAVFCVLDQSDSTQEEWTVARYVKVFQSHELITMR